MQHPSCICRFRLCTDTLTTSFQYPCQGSVGCLVLNKFARRDFTLSIAILTLAKLLPEFSPPCSMRSCSPHSIAHFPYILHKCLPQFRSMGGDTPSQARHEVLKERERAYLVTHPLNEVRILHVSSWSRCRLQKGLPQERIPQYKSTACM